MLTTRGFVPVPNDSEYIKEKNLEAGCVILSYGCVDQPWDIRLVGY